MSTSTVDHIPQTFGAVLLGGFFSSWLSGAVSIQTFIYYKLYPADFVYLKLLAVATWVLDLLHTIFICVATWDYLIIHYGEGTRIDVIPWSLALTIQLTAVLTFLVHIFYAHRILMLSKRNWFLTVPILFLALFRLACATVTTAKMIALGSFTAFKAEVEWIFTLGLALSSVIDIIITASLFLLLRTNKSHNGTESLNAIINALILYAFETGSLTCAGTVASMICWLAMPSNLIFMGLHFVIGKLYANSLFVTLNTRKNIRYGGRSFTSMENAVGGGGGGGGQPNGAVLVMSTRNPDLTDHYDHSDVASVDLGKPTELQINVERSVQYTSDFDNVPKVTIHRQRS